MADWHRKPLYDDEEDREFLRIVYPKMQSLMRYLMEQTNELGFIYGREKDWIFIDWSEMDKEGNACCRTSPITESLPLYDALAEIS